MIEIIIEMKSCIVFRYTVGRHTTYKYDIENEHFYKMGRRKWEIVDFPDEDDGVISYLLYRRSITG